MTKKDLEHKAELLKEALTGTRTKLDAISIEVDKDTFKALYAEAGEPTMFEPQPYNSEYWYTIKFDNLSFFICYKPKAVTTYETL